MAAKKNSGRGKSKGLTKTGFIRSLPESTPAEEVITKGKEAGLDLTKKLVWTTQSEMRTGGKTAGEKGKKAPKGKRAASAARPSTTAAAAGAPAAAAAPTAKPAKKRPGPKPGFRKAAALSKAATKASLAAGPEQKMRALIVELGTARAEQVYRAVKSQLDALVGGA